MQPDNRPDHSYYENPKSEIPKRKRGRFFFWLLISLFILGIAFVFATAFAYKFYSTSKKVIEANPPSSFFQSIQDVTNRETKPLRGESEGRVNVLFLGLAGENYPGENLTDSIIIASVNPKTYQTAMLSIPRDLYVRIPETNSYTKINALYARGHDRNGKATDGINDLKETLAEITGLNIHYYFAIDFDGFKKVVDELGGIKVQVQKDIHDERYPGPNFSYQTFDISKGLYTFDGATALKFARTRHDEDGDFGRAYRQQQILEAARSKAFSVGTLMNIPAINNVLNILGDHLRTDVPLDEMESFLELTKKIDTHTTTNKVMDAGHADSLMAVSHVYLGGIRAFILIPRTGSYDEIQDVAKNIFDLDLIERKRKSVEEENASVTIVNRSGASNLDGKISSLLEKMGYNPKIATVGATSASKNNPIGQTEVFDISKTKPFSLEDLSKKLNADVAQNPPGDISTQCQKTDFCLVAGADLTESLNYEENSVEELEEGYDKQQIDERTYIELLKKGSVKRYN
jgi:LCP family protein required for cell wall assembly